MVWHMSVRSLARGHVIRVCDALLTYVHVIVSGDNMSPVVTNGSYSLLAGWPLTITVFLCKTVDLNKSHSCF